MVNIKEMDATLRVIINKQIALTNQVHVLNEMFSQQTKSLLQIQRRKKRNIQRLKMKINMLSGEWAAWGIPRNVWIQPRDSSFWEKDVSENNDEFFKEHFRMSRSSFNILCRELQYLAKHKTNFRKSIGLSKRIAIALYALGSSADYNSIGKLFGVAKSTVATILKTFCEEVCKSLGQKYLNKYPLTAETLRDCVGGFQQLGLPQCLGVIGSRHFEIRQHPPNSQDFHNGMGWYSIVLMALVDYRNRFLYINIGTPGSCKESQIFQASLLQKHHTENPLFKEMSLQMSGVDVPIFILGGPAFPFSDILMKPYPCDVAASGQKKSFNKTIAKYLGVADRTFNQLKARFRLIEKDSGNHIENTTLLIKSTCVLHNFLNEHNDEMDSNWLLKKQNADINKWRPQPQNHAIPSGNESTAENIRAAISNFLYF